MTNIRYFLILLALATIESAIINKRDSIPVRVVYEGRIHPSVRNLDQREDVIEEQTVNDAGVEHSENNQVYVKGIKNLSEKPQLSPEEVKLAIKHIPTPIEEGLREADEIVVERAEGTTEESESGGEESGNLFDQIKEIVYRGLDDIRSNVDKLASAAGKPVEEAWQTLNKTITDIFEKQPDTVILKQATQPPNQNQNVFTNIVNNVQNAANNFVQSLQQNRPGNGPEDEQPGGGNWGQNIISNIQGGFQQVINNISNLGGQTSTSSTVLGDTGVAPTTQSSIIGNIVNTFQQFIGGNNQGNPIQQITNQSDTGAAPTTQPNLVQNVVNQISQVANNFRPTRPPASQGDEGTTTQRGPVQIIQQIGSQINSAIFGSTTNKPAGAEDETTQVQQSNNIIQNIGQALQNVNPFRPQQQQGQQPAGSNPITAGAQNVGSQIQQGIQNAVNQSPLGSSTTVKSEDEQKGGTEPTTTVKEIMETAE